MVYKCSKSTYDLGTGPTKGPGSTVECVTMSMSSKFVYELNGNKGQFARIRDKNVNFFLCYFHRFVIYLQRECF